MEPARRLRPDRWVTIPDQSSAPFDETAPRRTALPCRTFGAGLRCVRSSPLVAHIRAAPPVRLAPVSTRFQTLADAAIGLFQAPLTKGPPAPPGDLCGRARERSEGRGA